MNSAIQRRTGFVCHESYMWHDTGSAAGFVPAGGLIQPDRSFEQPSTKSRLRGLLEVTGLLESLVPIKPRHATVEELCRFHTLEYVDRIRALSDDQGGDAGQSAPFGRGGFDIASLSVGGVIAALDAVVEGRVDNAYALVRPPGHHAEAALGRGFCIFGNVAVAVLHARAVHGLERVAIVDWDVHHGNGTQAAFYADPSVLTVSIHQDRNFPFDTGHIAERGEGDGFGYNINVPLPPGSGHGAYVATMERVVLPALQTFGPELIVVSCGFDAAYTDPLGRMLCSSQTFRELARRLVDLAGDLCEGRLLLSHEGGYCNMSVPPSGLAVIEELSGVSTDYVDLTAEVVREMGGFGLEHHQDEIIKRAAEVAEQLVEIDRTTSDEVTP